MATNDQHEKAEQRQDRALEDSFPASDAPANSGITGAEPLDTPPNEHDIDAQPTGTPTSDRHAAETVHQSEPETKPSA